MAALEFNETSVKSCVLEYVGKHISIAGLYLLEAVNKTESPKDFELLYWTMILIRVFCFVFFWVLFRVPCANI